MLCHSEERRDEETKNLNTQSGCTQILPPYGRQDDTDNVPQDDTMECQQVYYSFFLMYPFCLEDFYFFSKDFCQ